MNIVIITIVIAMLIPSLAVLGVAAALNCAHAGELDGICDYGYVGESKGEIEK